MVTNWLNVKNAAVVTSRTTVRVHTLRFSLKFYIRTNADAENTDKKKSCFIECVFDCAASLDT